MNIDAVARQALVAWLLFPAIGLPAALVARRLGHPGFLPRLAVWLAIVPTVLVASYAGPWAFVLLLAVCCVVACREVCHFTRARAWQSGVSAAVAVAGIIAPLMVGDAAWPWLLAGVVLGAFVFRVGPAPLTSLVVAVALGASLGFWTLLQVQPEGFRFVLFAFSVVAVGDIMAFFSGRFLGGRRLFPRLSPHKTLGGYAGGIVISVLASWILSFAMPEFGWLQLTGAGIIVGLAGAAGDLAASAVKRRYGVKDSGRVLGPLGGMVDRLDSLAGAGWVFYLLIRFT